jgi:chromosome partitioning protein
MLILVGGQKGGTGKSTTATNLITIRTLKGRDTFLFDIDPQNTSTLWASRRDENNVAPRIPSSQKVLDRRIINAGTVIRNEIKALIPRYDDIIIDAGGADNEVLRAAMTLADVLILPLMPSAFDTWTLDTINNLVAEARETNPKLIAKVLYNKVATQPQTARTEIEESDEILSDFDNLQRFKSVIVFRVSVRRSQSHGLSVIEYKPIDEKAIEEMNVLYEEVFNEKAVPEMNALCEEISNV